MDILDPKMTGLFIALIIVSLLIYFIPSRIAFGRKIKNRRLLFLLNLLFALSFSFAPLSPWSTFFYWLTTHWLGYFLFFARPIFWIVAIIWACAGKKEEQENLNIQVGKNE